MSYTLTGSLCGTVAKGFEDPLTGGVLGLYELADDEDREGDGRTDGGVAAGRETTRERGTFAVLDEDEVEAKSGRLLGETEVGEGGEYEVTLGDGESGAGANYRGQPVEVDLRFDRLPGESHRDDVDPVQVTVTDLMPDWRETDEKGELAATWNHSLTAKQWCGVRALFGVWTVCGRVTDTFGMSVANATVRAFDADIVQDDLVGSDTTDARGRYRIDYRKAAFETTPTPWPSVELEHGPDFYFTVESGGEVRLNESRSDGRQPGREDASHCEVIDLEVPAFTFVTPTLWTGIGTEFRVPSGPQDLNDVDAEGYLGAKKFALTGRPAMTGRISERDFMDRGAPGDASSIEYRFAVFDTTGQAVGNNVQTPPELEDVTDGRLVSGSLFESTVIGTIQYFPSGGEVSFDVPLEEGHVRSGGWIDVRDVVDDAFTRPDTGPATDLEDALRNHGPVYYDDADPLIGINTNAVTTEQTPTSNPGDIDDALAGGTTDVETMAVRFETRRSGDTGPADGKTVNSVVVNNTGTFRELEVFNADGTPVTCQGQSGEMTLSFNVYHPHLRDANLTVRANGTGSDSIAPPDVANPPNEVIPGDNTDPTVESASGSFEITQKLDHTCAYTVNLWTQRRLHDGDRAVGGDGSVEETFFYDAS